MTCQHCEKPAHALEMCQMHYRRFRLYGNAFHKRRQRGVMDAPVTYPLGPLQAQILVTLFQNPGRSFSYAALTGSKSGTETAVRILRKRYGADVIETTIVPHGYRLNPATARRLAEVIR